MAKVRRLPVGSEHFSVRTNFSDGRCNRRIVGSNFRRASAPKCEAKSSSAERKAKIWQANRTLTKSDLFIPGKTYRETGVIGEIEVVKTPEGLSPKSRTLACDYA